MNSGQVYAKTPIGDEAVRQSTRVVQRNLRMVLVQVDGKLTVGELSAKIGNARLVEGAIRELESGGYIVPLAAAAAAWEQGQLPVRKEQVSAISRFSTFGTTKGPTSLGSDSQTSRFSSFGKPILPASRVDNDELQSTRKTGINDDADIEPENQPSRQSRPAVVLGSAFAFIVLCALGLLLYPYNNHKIEIERIATNMLNTAVTIDDVSLQFLPTPHLLLQGVHLSGIRDGRIASLQIHNPMQLILGGVGSIEKITALDPELSVEDVLGLPFAALNENRTNSALHQILISNLRVHAGSSMVFGPLNGKILLANGHLESAQLENPDRSLLLKATPRGAGFDVAMEGRAWRPPGLPVSFAALQARGVLQADNLQINDIDTTFLGGVLKGDWRLSWHDGVSMSGMGLLTRIDLRKLSADLALAMNIEGDLGGTLRIDGQGSDWAQMWQSASAQMKVEIVRGIIHGTDIGEAGRRGTGAVVRSGVTRFDRLDADIGIDKKGVSVRNIRLDAGLMTASGQVQANPDGMVEGRLMLIASSSVATIRAPLLVNGQLPNLTVTADK